MKKFSASCAVAMLAAASQGMAADQLSYNRIDVGFAGSTYHNTANEDIPGLGLKFEGSWEFSPHIHGFGGLSGMAYVHTDEDEEAGDFAIGRFELGVGVNTALAPGLDFVAGVSLQSYAESYPNLEDEEADDTFKAVGPGINVGLRGLIGRRVGWDAGLKYARVKFDEDAFDAKMGITGLRAGMRFQINRLFGVGADLGFNLYDIDDYSAEASDITLAVMFRLQFNDRDGSPQWDLPAR
jgi:hypothetical protein